MIMLVLQTLLLMAIAYLIGCILGCLLHQLFSAAPKAAPVEEPAPKVAATASPRTAMPPPPPPPPAPKPAAAPAPKSAPKPASAKKAAPPAAAKTGKKDDLKRIRGIGRQNEARLNAVGITTFEQIAGWSKKDQAEMGERLAFPGRIEREDWVKQAMVLAKGDQTAFSKRVAKGDVSTSVGKGSVGATGAKPPAIAKPRGGKGDKLTEIGGVGPAIEKKLNALGIFHFDQIAKWTTDHQAWIGNEIGFPGRPEREDWVAEAKKLAGGSS